MKYMGKAQAIARKIVDAFRTGTLPNALAVVFVQLAPGDSPSLAWSFNNRLLIALDGHTDARGFRQWEKVKRHVRKGALATYILGPMVVKTKDKTTGEDRRFILGFKAIPVFGYAATDGEPVPGAVDRENMVQRLPLAALAQAWGLKVEVIAGSPSGPLGTFQPGRGIVVRVENLATWAHELCHASDHRLGALTERGQHVNSETVAELGGAVLLEALGYPDDADVGGAYRYIKSYCDREQVDIITVCMQLVDRTSAAVAYILEEAATLAGITLPPGLGSGAAPSSEENDTP